MPGKSLIVYAAMVVTCLAMQQSRAQEAAVLEAPAETKLTLASVFSDHMVLQRGRIVPIWGAASPGDKVRVQLGEKNAEITADEDGKWRVDIGPLSVGEPLELTVRTDGTVLNLTDVLVGEVWIASGQSNMQWPVKKSNKPKKEIAAADWPKIRLLTVSRVALPSPQEEFDSYGWQVCSPETVKDFSAVAYFFGRDLHENLEVPIGLISTNVGGTPMEAWTSRTALAARPTFVGAAKVAEAALNSQDKLGKGHPSGLFNAMIHPLVPFGMRGVIWYQGEANAKRHQHYHELSEVMITDWRQRWGQGDFPFLLVQLAAWKPDASTWPELREAQHQTVLTEKNVGMAVATDIGDKADIHPRNKQDVGKRLALAAHAMAYGEDVVYSGPTYKKMNVVDGQCVVSFDHVAGGLQLGRGGVTAEGPSELNGFEVAGADGEYVAAEAKIEGGHVIVSSDQVANPVAVRYNWAGWTEGNLYNSAGLPAPPFRTARF